MDERKIIMNVGSVDGLFFTWNIPGAKGYWGSPVCLNETWWLFWLCLCFCFESYLSVRKDTQAGLWSTYQAQTAVGLILMISPKSCLSCLEMLSTDKEEAPLQYVIICIHTHTNKQTNRHITNIKTNTPTRVSIRTSHVVYLFRNHTATCWELFVICTLTIKRQRKHICLKPSLCCLDADGMSWLLWACSVYTIVST